MYEYNVVASSVAGVEAVVVEGFSRSFAAAVVPVLLAHSALEHGAAVWARVRALSSGGSRSPWVQSDNRSRTTVRCSAPSDAPPF